MENLRQELNALVEVGVVSAARVRRAHAWIKRNQDEVNLMIELMGSSETADAVLELNP